MKSFELFILAINWLIIFSQSMYPSVNGDEYVFHQLTIEDGLSQSTVLGTVQDHKGYMWFGTAFGLNKYDGYNFTVYTNTVPDSTKISDNRITCLIESSDKIIWVGTISGDLNKYDRMSNSFSSISFIDTIKLQYNIPDQYYEYPLSYSRNDNHSITSIAEDYEGFLWIGTWGKGLFRFDKKNNSYKHFYHSPDDNTSLSYNRITKVIVDHSGVVWVGTFGGGLNKVINNNQNLIFQQFKNTPNDINSLSDDKVISLFEDSDKNLWVGTYYGGLNRLNLNTEYSSDGNKTFYKFRNIPGDRTSLSNNTVMAIAEDKSGNLWIGTFGGGLNRFDKQTESFAHFKNDPFNKNSLGDNDVLSIYCDRTDIIWIGTHLGQGLNKLEKNKVKFATITNIPGNKNSLSDGVIWSVFQDSKNIFWFGTYRGGLNRFDRQKNKFTHFKPSANSITDLHIRAFAEDSYGNLWIGTYSGGLNRYNLNSKTFSYYKHNPSDPTTIGADQIQSIYIDSESVMWLATFGGGLNYAKLSPDPSEEIIFHSLTNIPGDSNSINDNRVYSLCQARNGILWVGTFGGGLHKFDKVTKKFTRYVNDPDNKNSLSNNRVMSIYEDGNGMLWLGTFNGGLNRFDPKNEKFKRYADKEGLLSGVVYGILEDTNNNLWMSTNKGIYKFNISTEIFVQYDLRDGLQSLEFSGGAYFKTKDGEMYFGGINGINHFYPDSIGENQYIPPVVITSIKVFNTPIEGEQEQIELAYDYNFLTFEFASLDYTNPPDNYYSYTLEGLDKEWRFTNSDLRIANYTNLAPGEYIFRVKGTNSDGIWNEKGAMIRIIITPPFWQTWWFMFLTIIFAGSVIYYLSTIRIKNLLAIEKLKTKLAADLHDNIGSGLTEISILSELVVSDISSVKEGASQKLRSISDTARLLVDNMSDIVWVVNPKRDSLYDLILRLKDSYSELLSSMEISFKTSNLEKLTSIKLPMEYRQSLFLIFKEAINNSIKHSQCKNLTLDANVHGDNIEMTLVDDGIGMNEINMMIGNGIKNIESRARSIGGRIKWITGPGEGTVVKFLGRSGKNIWFRNFFSKNYQ